MDLSSLRFDVCAEDTKYIECATRHDIVKHVCNSLFDNGWLNTFDYLKYQPKSFTSKKLSPPRGTHREFVKFIDYCYLLSRQFTDRDEAARYKDKQGISIYFSVVLYWLLVYFGVASEKKLKFFQGYYRYKIKEGIRPNPRYRAGMHCWLSCDDAVLDVTIWQQQQYFDFESCGFRIPAILGEIPEGLGLIGFEEDKSLIKEYARRFARESGLKFVEWLNFHKKQADLLAEARSVNDAKNLA